MRSGRASRASCCFTRTGTASSTFSIGRTDRCCKTGNLATKVTWVKGFTADGKPIVDPGSVATRDGIAACPGGGGGANFYAVSYNPVTKLFYVRVSDSCQVYTSHEDPLGARGNRWFGGGPASEKARAALAALTKGYAMGTFIRAMDPFTATKAWDIPNPGGEPGILSTATGLVFLAGDGGLLVLDGKTGKAAAEHQPRPHLGCRADDLHGGREAIHCASQYGDADGVRASLGSAEAICRPGCEARLRPAALAAVILRTCSPEECYL